MINKIKSALPLLLVVTLSLLAVRVFFLPGYFENHDGIIHVMRLAHFDEALRNGQFPVRWVTTWMAGYGSPVFNFNWTLPYYLGSLLHLFGMSFQTSVETLFVLSMVISAITMYVFLKELTSDVVSAFTGAALYVWAPYRFTDTLIRGALGEALSFVLFPLLFLGLLRLLRTGRYPLWMPFVWAILILTHNIMAVIGGGVWLFSAFFLVPWKTKFTVLLKTCGVFLVGVLLTSYFWLPALAEKQFDRIADLNQFYNNASHYVPLSSLITSVWRYAYAVPQHPEVSMSFQVGKVHLAALCLVPISLLLAFRRKKTARELHSFLWLFLLITAGSIVMTNGISRFVYDVELVSSIINFPWRFLELTTLGMSCLVGLTLTYMGKLRYLLATGLVGGALYLYWPYSKIVSYTFNATDKEYRTMVKTNIGYTPDTEYLPKGTNYIPLLEDRGLAETHALLEPISGSLNLNVPPKYRNLNLRTEAQVARAGEIRFQQFAFPGWEVKVDGASIIVVPDQYGLITFPVDIGAHTIEVAFRNTPIRTVANTISLISLTALGIYVLRYRMRGTQ